MATLTETAHAFGFLVSEAPGHISRDVETIVVPAGATFVSGEVLGELTATGKLTAYNDAGVDGEETASAILGEGIDNSAGATDLEVSATVINFCAEVYEPALAYQAGVTTTAVAGHLAAKGIKVRTNSAA